MFLQLQDILLSIIKCINQLQAWILLNKLMSRFILVTTVTTGKKDHLQRHIDRKHHLSVCDDCGQFEEPSLFRSHQRRVHGLGAKVKDPNAQGVPKERHKCRYCFICQKEHYLVLGIPGDMRKAAGLESYCFLLLMDQ